MSLTVEELTTLEYISALRYKYNRKNAIKDEQIGDQSAKETDFIGMSAEFAFCKHFNIYPDIGVTTPKPFDCILHGKTFDVKGTKYKTGKMLLRQMDNHIPCDFYALVTGDPRIGEVIIRGFLKREEFIVNKRLDRMKEGAPLSYIATQGELHSFRK